MSLPFPNEEEKPKYQCFVCGIMEADFEEFKKHIIENHEEGREYIKCPLEHCGAPVRDLIMHIKVKHPSVDHKKITGQSKAIIWYDFSPNGRKKVKKPAFRKGKYVSSKTGRVLNYRSGLEEKVYQLLDEDRDVMGFDVEPFRIPYIFEGTAHDYLPDIFVNFHDGHRELWEVKPSDQTALPVNKAKWHAAKEACRQRGWNFEVYTEIRIDQLKKKIRDQRLFG